MSAIFFRLDISFALKRSLDQMWMGAVHSTAVIHYFIQLFMKLNLIVCDRLVITVIIYVLLNKNKTNFVTIVSTFVFNATVQSLFFPIPSLRSVEMNACSALWLISIDYCKWLVHVDSLTEKKAHLIARIWTLSRCLPMNVWTLDCLFRSRLIK